MSPGYLQPIHAPLLAGAWCPELRTDFSAPKKVMVNRRFVDLYARGANVVGRHLRWPDMASAAGTPQAEIVGVIGNIKEDAVGAPAYPYVYGCAIGGGWPDSEYVVRASGEPRAVLQSIRDLVHRIDSSRAVFGARPLDAYLDTVLDRPRSNAQLLALFAFAAMTLAALGLYGLVANMVSARRREIGVRMALGAQPAQIVRTMVGGVGVLIGAGIAAGAGVMAVAQALLRAVVFGITPLDGASLCAAAGLLVVVSGLAALVAARRATAVNPMEAIRAE